MILIQKADDFTRIGEIRLEIFNKELGLSNSDIFDADDEVLEQFLIINDDKIVGTFRLRETVDSHKIERMGILPEHRSKGYGKLAIEEIKKYSKNAGKSKIVLDSIYHVRDFYAKSGFVVTGGVYCKVGIPHVKMYLKM